MGSDEPTWTPLESDRFWGPHAFHVSLDKLLEKRYVWERKNLHTSVI